MPNDIKFQKFIFIIISVLLLLYIYQSFNNIVDSKQTITLLFSINVLLLFGVFVVYIILNFKTILLSKIKILSQFKFWLIGIFLANIFTSFVVSRNITEIIHVTLPTLSLFVFYLIFKKINLIKVHLFFSVLLTILLVLLYFKDYKLTNSNLNDIKASLNIAYFPFLLLPTLLLIKKKYIKIIFTLIISIVIFTSMKRAGLLALFISMFAYVYIEYTIFRKRKLNFSSIFFSVIFISIFILGFQYFDKLNDGSFTTRIQSTTQDEGSGRITVYKDVINLIEKNNFVNTIFGNGENAVMRNSSSGYSAHNDFLEVYYDYGMIMFLIYIFIHFKLIQTLLILIRKKSYFAAPFSVSYFQFLTFSMISHVIVYPYFILITSFWGIILGSIEKKHLIINE